GDANVPPAGESRLRLGDLGGGNLSDPVGAEIEEEDGGTLTDAAGNGEGGPCDEFIADCAGIGVGKNSPRPCEARPRGLHHRVIGLCNALPSSVAIHGVVPAADGCDRNGSGQRGDQPRNVRPGGAWRRVATVGESMYDRWHGGFGEDAGERSG